MDITQRVVLKILFFLFFLSSFESYFAQSFPLRILAANVGNATPLRSWENKLERPQDVINARNYIDYWKPDIVLLSEIYDASQMKTLNHNGPVLPSHYDFSCGQNVTRGTAGQTSWFPPSNNSHEHECVAWNNKVFELVAGSQKSVYGRDDDWGKNNCNYDFTAHRVQLKHKRYKTIITAVAVHPNSTKTGCRTFEISNYWSQLVGNAPNAIIAGDWNTDLDTELQKPANFQTIFSKGNYWNNFYSPTDYSATYVTGDRHLDHAFSNFGFPCKDCGSYYNGINLPYGVALGGYQGHPRMDNGDGFDHRQMLIDLTIPYSPPTLGAIGLDVSDLTQLFNVPQINSNKVLVIDSQNVVGYFDYSPLAITSLQTNPNNITDEVVLRNVPLLLSNKILTINDSGEIGYQTFFNISNTDYTSSISGKIGITLSNALRLKKMTIKPENAGAYYVLVLNANGIVGKRPLTDILN